MKKMVIISVKFWGFQKSKVIKHFSVVMHKIFMLKFMKNISFISYIIANT